MSAPHAKPGGEGCLSSDGYTSVSESEAERDAADQYEAAEAAALEKDLGEHEGAEELSTLEVVQRRKSRVDRLLGLYQKQHWRLLERARMKHRKYYLRRGRSAAKLVKAPGDTTADDGGVACSLGVCDAPKCTGLVMPLAKFCVRHILLQPGQCLYVADKRGLPVRRTGSEPAEESSSDGEDKGEADAVKDKAGEGAPTAMQTEAPPAPVPEAESTVKPMES